MRHALNACLIACLVLAPGGGFGCLFLIGEQPINIQLQGFHNVEHPDTPPEANLRLQVQVLFPQ